MRKIIFGVFALLAVAATGFAVEPLVTSNTAGAYATGDTVCQTATATAPGYTQAAHTIADNGIDIHTIPGKEQPEVTATAQACVTVPSPSATTAYVDAGLSIEQSGYKLDNFTLRDQRNTSAGTSGLVVTNNAENTEISNIDIGPTSDNGILIYTHEHGGHYIHDGKIHESANPSFHPWGTHGIYDTAKDTKVARVESYQHPHGACFSIRQPNNYFQVTAHDSASGVGITDYSLGQGYNLVLRELLAYKLTRVAVQMDGVRFSYGGAGMPAYDTPMGNETFGIEIDHATLDLRGMNPEWYGAPISLGPTHHPSYITNSIIIWDGNPGAWLQRPASGTVNLTGTVMLNSSQAAQYLGVNYVPVRVAGSPLIGKASSYVPPRTAALGYGTLPDVGRFQAP